LTERVEKSASTHPPRWRGALAFAVMIAAVVLTYVSPELFRGKWRLEGLDYTLLHERRIDFALEQIKATGAIPAWYPREQFGVPFWSNVQSFPFIPTRLALLPVGAANLFTFAVNLSAILAATFTFLLARRLGIGAVGAGVAGYTFACCGYFASRVLAGQLGMLEAYPALPMLLWIVERLATAPPGRSAALWTAALSLASGSFALSAHPQLSIYALAAAAGYALFRCGLRRVVLVGLAMLLGVGLAGFSLYPMVKLLARSSRVLSLDPPANDIAMPYRRLMTMLLPWRDGAPQSVRKPAGVGPVTREYPSNVYFWDTVSYIGWLPVAAPAVLLGWALWTHRRPTKPAVYFILLAVVSLLLALPLARDALPPLPFVVLRSPARLMYLVGFALALAAGAMLDVLLAIRALRAAVAAAVALLVAAHALDLSRHARCYVKASPETIRFPEGYDAQIRAFVGDGRAAFDVNMNIELNRRIDDIGFFDSIMLAGTYRGFIDLAGVSPRLNVQDMNGGELPASALEACAVRLVMTAAKRPEPPTQRGEVYSVYTFPNAAARVAWFGRLIERMDAPATSDAMRNRTVDLRNRLLLPPDAPRVSEEGTTPRMLEPLTIRHRRPGPDRIEIPVDVPEPGYVRVLESFDMGWSATVDGAPAAVVPAHNMAMAVPVPAGKHEVVLQFRTPGRRAGIWISLISLKLLASLCGLTWRAPFRGKTAG